MNKNIFKTLTLILTIIMGGLFIGCQDEDSAADVENYVLQSMYEIEERSGTGMAGCYELVFPVTVQFPDSTTQEVADYAALKLAIREWYEANGGRPRPHARPHLVFPYDVITGEGEIITVTNFAELMELRHACMGAFGPNHHGHFGKDRHCFKPVFPFTLEFPDSSLVTITTPQELRQAIREWKQANPGVQGRPEFVFPITVQLRDGTQVVINSAEELAALKEDCRG